MKELHRLGLPAYLLAAILILFPVLDVLTSVWPFQPGSVTWRFSTVGLLIRVAVTPLLGLVAAYAAALLLGHARVLRVLSAISGVSLLVLLVVLGVFVMDGMQMRSMVSDEAVSRFRSGAVAALGKAGLGLLFLVLLAMSQWRAGGALEREQRLTRPRASGVVVPPQGSSRMAPSSRSPSQPSEEEVPLST